MLSVGITVGLVLMFIWGVAGFLFTIPVKKIGNLKTQFASNVLAFVPLIIAIILYYDAISITLVNLLLLILAGLSIVIGIYYYYKGIEIGGDVSILSPIQGSFSVITVVLSFIFLKEPVYFTKVMAIILILLGIILTSTDLKKIRSLHSEKGVKYVLIAMLLLGIQFFLLAIVSKDITLFGIRSDPLDHINLFIFTTIINPTFFVLFAILKKQVPTIADMKRKAVAPILIITAVMFAIAWFAMNYGLSFGQVTLLVPVSSLSPAITVILAVLFYKEKLVLNQKLGILTILLGLFLISL